MAASEGARPPDSDPDPLNTINVILVITAAAEVAPCP